MIRLYDTLTGTVRPVEFRDEGKVSLYACGPTVYDHPHVGHARSALTYDILRRYLEWTGLEVTLAANITDIDDKIIAKAAAEKRTEAEVAAEFERSYIEAMDAINVLPPHHRPHATEYVSEMIEFVGGLVESGAAYANDAGVYLRVGRLSDYGALVHRTPEDLREGAGARVEVDTNKEDPLDFALWKSAKPGEPTWDSPWGPGRPGWHIECVAMSMGILGEDFDIHGGGDDLAFPHHENERAEATASGRQFARHWVHHAMVNVAGEKMSKSLGNFRTAGDLFAAHDPRAFRLLILQTHYRKTMEINTAVMTQAETALGRFEALARRATAAGLSVLGGTLPDERVTGQPVLARPDLDTSAVEAFRSAMDHDLGTPEATATVFDTIRRANAALDAGAPNAEMLVRTVFDLAGALGLEFGRHISVHIHDVVGIADTASAEITSTDPTSTDTPAAAATATRPESAEIDSLVQARSKARTDRDFAKADRLRDELTALGIVVEDTPNGPIWHRA